MFIAGIDGGGTHTRLEIRDLENRLISRAEFGPFNINSIGEEVFRNLLREVFACCGAMEQCAAICVGGAGISNPRVKEVLAEELSAANFSGKWKLCGDQEIALRGAMDGAGVALIAGTGSICFGKNALGETARSGGFGHLVDDGGSGYALGRDVLSAALRTVDGRADSPKLLEAVYERLGACDPGTIVSFVYSPKTDKAAIAKFSAIALQEPEATAILLRGAEELYEMVQAVQRKLSLSGCPIALLGGLLLGDNPYRRVVKDKLSQLGSVISPSHDALWGAAQTAWELYNEC